MKQVLIYIRPLDKAAGARRDIRVGDGPSGETYGALGQVWEPAITARPQLSIELFNPDLDGGVATGKAQFSLQLDGITSVPAPETLYWKGAPVTIYSDDAGQAGGGVEFDGYVSDASLDVDTNRLTISAEVSDTLLDKPLLTAKFTGGGGIGGDAGRRGVLLPAGFGSVKNIEPVWFDLTRNIGMIDGYANTVSIDWLGEGLNDFGAAVADYASYAELAAAIDAKDIKPGQWGKCTASGLVGLGAPPVAPITVHARFGSNRAGALIRRICQVHAGIDVARIDVAAFDTVDAAVNRPVHYWTNDDRNVKDLAEAIARSCNATLLLSFQGKITITRAVPSAPVLTLDRSGGGSPRVIRWRAGSVQAPYFQIRARAARPARVLRFEEVNYVDTIEDKGLYLGDQSYRAGNVVWLSDGSQWLYISEAVTSGNSPAAVVPPATSNAYWRRLQPAKVASDFRYSTGQTIEALRPAEAGANVTESRTAAAISGQGALATQNNVTYSTQVSGLPVALQPGQLWGGQYIVGINTVYSTGATVESLRPAESGANVTESRTAAAVAGQGALATQSSVTYSTQISGLPAPIQPGNLNSGRIDASQVRYWGGPLVVDLKPGEAGANVTETRSAASIAGQGAGATANSLAQLNAAEGARFAGIEAYASNADNILPNPIFADGLTIWTPAGGTWTRDSAAGANWPAANAAKVVAAPGQTVRLLSPLVQVLSKRMFFSCYSLSTTSDLVVLFARWYRGDGTIGGYPNVASYVVDGSTGWTYTFGWITLPNNAAFIDCYFQQTNTTGADQTTRVTCIRLAPTAPGATVGAQAGTDLFRADGTTVMGQAEVRTAEGTAAAIAGQGALATLSTADWSTRVSGAGKPENNADVTATAQITFALADIDIAADASGTIGAGQLPRTVVPVVARGATNIRTDAGTAYAISGISSNLTGYVTVSNIADATKGQVTVAAGITGSGTFVITATIGGVAYARTVAVTVRRAAPATGGGTGTKSASADLGGKSVGSTSYTEMVKFSAMTVGSGETVTAQLSADYMLATNITATNTAKAKWQTSPAGAGSWTDMAAPVTGSNASFDAGSFDSSPGSIAVTQTATPSAGSYDIRLVMAKSGAANIYIDNGFAGVTIA